MKKKDQCCSKIDTFKLDKKCIRSDIIAIAWPSVTELILVTLCQMMDMIMVGRLGAYAISAVGLTSQPKFVMLATFIALNVGTTALVARLKGEKDFEGANRVVRQSLLLTLGLACIISVVGVVFAEGFIRLMGGEPETIKPGTEYFQILMGGFIFTAVPLCISAALRGVGNTKASLRFNVIANGINVVLNYLLIYGNFGFPALGMAGAALATVLGTVVSSWMAIAVLLQKEQDIRISFKDEFRPDFRVIQRIVRIGLPAAGEQLAIRLGLLVYTRTVSGLGTLIFATHQIALNILSLSFMSGQAFGIAATSLVGQNLGGKRPDLAKAYASETRFLGSMVSTLMGAVFFFFGSQLVALYTNDPGIIQNGGLILKLVGLLQPFQSSFLIIAGALRGAGDTKSSAISVFIGILIIRPLLSVICVFWLNWGLVGAWIALIADQVIRWLLLYLRFRSNRWTSLEI